MLGARSVAIARHIHGRFNFEQRATDYGRQTTG